jgi:hypothetical protein
MVSSRSDGDHFSGSQSHIPHSRPRDPDNRQSQAWSALIFIWETITLSNRFAGPVSRLHDIIRSLNAGEAFEPIRFRKVDFWREVADDFKAMVERFNDQPATEESEQEEPVSVS